MRASLVLLGLALALVLTPSRVNERCAHACSCRPPEGYPFLEPETVSYATLPTEDVTFRTQRIHWSVSGDHVYLESNGYTETYVRVR